MPDPVFEKVAPVVRFPEAEARVREFWQREGIFEKSLAKRADGPRYVFYEGPPTANGLPHNGHVLTRVMKDVFPRYKAMRGFDVPRKAGWDTHGLPVEIEVEKELRISGKDAIVEYGVEPFVRRCLDSVFRYTRRVEQTSPRSSASGSTSTDAYVTYHESYVESVWWALSELFTRSAACSTRDTRSCGGGPRAAPCSRPPRWARATGPSTIPRSTCAFRCATSPDTLAAGLDDDAVDAALELPRRGEADVDYAVVRDGEQRKLIVAEALVETLAEKVGRELPVERTLRGAELVGRRYAPPFDWFERSGRSRPAGAWSAPTSSSSTPAPASCTSRRPSARSTSTCLRREQQGDPELPLLCAVRPDGGFDPEIATPEYAGRWVKECDRDLTRELKERGSAGTPSRSATSTPSACARTRIPSSSTRGRPGTSAPPPTSTRRWPTTPRSNGCPSTSATGASATSCATTSTGRSPGSASGARRSTSGSTTRPARWMAPASVAEILERNPSAFDAFDAARRRRTRSSRRTCASTSRGSIR